MRISQDCNTAPGGGAVREGLAALRATAAHDAAGAAAARTAMDAAA